MTRSSVRLLAVLAILLPALPGQCPMEWSRAFGPNGFDGPTSASVVHDDGSGPKLYVGGSFQNVDGRPAARIARFDGAAWEPVGSGTDGPVHALHVHDSGSGPRLVAAGLFTAAGGAPAANIAVWDGASWSALGGGLGGRVDALHSFDEGSGIRLFAGGTFTTAGGAPALRLARFDGSSWSPVGPGVDAGVEALQVFDDGSGPKLFIGGLFSGAGPLPSANVVRWDGVSMSAAGAGTSRPVHDFEVHDDGSGPRIFAATRSAGLAPTPIVLVWNGGAWADPGAGPCCLSPSFSEIYAKSLAVHDDGGGPKLYAGGTSVTAAGWTIGITNVIRWDGITWSPVGTSLGIVESLASFNDGNGAAVFACGAFATPLTRNIAKWQGGTLWSHLGAVIGGFDHDVLGFAFGDAGNGPALYAGGRFFKAGDQVAVRAAMLQSEVWQPLPGLSNTGYGIESLIVVPGAPGPGLVAAGDFFIDIPGTLNDLRVFLARWDGTAWSAIPTGPSYALTEVRKTLIFDAGSGPEIFVAARILQGASDVSGLGRWNGTAFSHVPSAPRIEDMIVFDAGTGPAIFAVARDIATPSGPQRGIVRWDGTSWTLLAGGLPPFLAFFGQPARMVAFDDGSGLSLFVGGSFATVAGQPANGIARWNGSWFPLPAGTVPNVITSLAVADDGQGPVLYAGGDLAGAAGVPGTNVASWNGSAWSPVGTLTETSAPPSYLQALLPLIDERGLKVMVGGHFTSAGGSPAWRISRLSAPAPTLSMAQPQPGAGLSVVNGGLCAGGRYYNLVSADLCPVGPGSGPFAGLCFTDPAALVFQLSLPPGAVPFHFLAGSPSAAFGPYALPPGLAFDAVCIDASGGVYRARSAVARILIQ